MEFGRLRNTLQRGDLWQDLLQEASRIEHFKSTPRATFCENSRNLVAHTLGRNGLDEWGQAPDRRESLAFNLESQPCGETNRPQQAQMIFAESPFRIADRADQLQIEIGAAAHEIQNLSTRVPGHAAISRAGIEQQRVDGEIAPQHILPRAGLEMYSDWTPAVGVFEIAPK